MRLASFLCVVAVGLVACSSPRLRPLRRPPALAQPPPAFARVFLMGVTIGPNKYDGSPWDGFGRVPSEIPQAIASALGAPDPVAAVLGVLAQPAVEALEKPETMGRAMLLSVHGMSPPIPLVAQRDTFTPQWQGAPSFAHVPLDGSTRIRVELLDEDLRFDDPMGQFELNAAEILAAVRTQRVYPVRVAEQTNRQVLFALISAYAE